MAVASLICLVSALWQHLAASAAAFAIEATTEGHVVASIGTVAMVLGWLVFVLSVGATSILVIMVTSTLMLDIMLPD